MKELLLQISEFIVSLLKNSAFIGILGLFFSGYIGHKSSKYLANLPYRLNIKQQQFEKVYLPLVHLVRKLPSSLSFEDALQFQKQLEDILEENYEYASPHLHELNQQLSEALRVGNAFQSIFSEIKHNILIDYEILKKHLGYPSENMLTIFSKMTFKQKCQSILEWFTLFSVLIPLFLIPYSMNVNEKLASALFLWMIISIPLSLKLQKIISKMKD